MSAIDLLASWNYVDFAPRVLTFFSKLLQSPTGFIAFELAVTAAKYFPANAQLLDELAVIVDPASVRPPLPHEQHPAWEHATAVTTRTLDISWGKIKVSSTPEEALRMPPGPMSLLDELLIAGGLHLYRSIFWRCGIFSPMEALRLTPLQLSQLNVREADFRKLDAVCRFGISTSNEQQEDASGNNITALTMPIRNHPLEAE